MSAVGAVVLDMGGVVYVTPFERMAAVETERDLPRGTLPRGPFGGRDPDYLALDRGDIDERTYWQRRQRDLAGRGIDFDVYQATRHHWHGGRRREVLAALEPIHRRYRQAILTNDAADWLGEGWWETWELARHFDAMIDAGEEGLKKPARAIYERVARALDVSPDRCLFVDDLTVNLDGARRAGMRAFRFDVTDPGGSVSALLEMLGVPARDRAGDARPPP